MQEPLGNDSVTPRDDCEKAATVLIEEHAVPFICVVGLIGNTVSAIVFSRRPLRNNSSSLLLIARSFSDNGFLATLLVIWASSVYDLRLGQVTVLCQLLIFLTYFFGCVSVWLVVLVTAENYIRICKPFLVSNICTTRNARTSLLVLHALVLGIYNFPLWTMADQCVPEERYYDFIQVMTYVDSVLTLIIPSAVMGILMSAVALTTVASCRRRRKMSTSSVLSHKGPLSKATKLLLAVTVAFVIFNLPYHAVRFRLMIITFVNKQHIAATLPLEFTLQSVSQLLYYLSMAVNVVIYASFSSKFWAGLKNLILLKKSDAYTSVGRRVPIYRTRKEVGISLPELTSCTSINNINNNKIILEEMQPLRRFKSSRL